MMLSVRQKRRPGEIRDAIIDYLRGQERQASVAEIRQAVAERFDGQLAESSVRSYLRLNTPAEFERITKGHYRLAGTAPIDFAADASEKAASQGAPFIYGRSKLFHADCLRWLPEQPENSIHAIVTDPPYGLLEYSVEQQDKLRRRKGGVWRIPPAFDGHARSPLPRFTVLEQSDIRHLCEFFQTWATACMRVLVPGAHVVVASNPLVSYRVAAAIVDAGFERRGEIIRLVMTLRGGDRPKNAHEAFPEVSVMARSMWEPWLLFRKPLTGRVQDNLRRWKTGGLRRPSLDKPFGDVIASHPTRTTERRLAPHPSLKPQSFLRSIVRAMLPMGEGIILDPFAGSGSTLAAAEAVGYAGIGVEKDLHYFNVAKEGIPRLRRLGTNSPASGTRNSAESALFPLD